MSSGAVSSNEQHSHDANSSETKASVSQCLQEKFLKCMFANGAMPLRATRISTSTIRERLQMQSAGCKLNEAPYSVPR
jgi:hypothetical protein